VEKRKIFLDDQDFAVFMSYLKEYLSFKDVKGLKSIVTSENATAIQKDKARNLLALNNFFNEIELIAYCLMPNHFHFLLRQANKDGIDKFIKSLSTRYTMYFNKKHKRVGKLYQGVYKAVLVESESQLLHLSRYIHLNPKKSDPSLPTSFPDFLKQKNTPWIHPEYVLNYFQRDNGQESSYLKFVESYADDEFIEQFKIDEN